jgi:hypothetical protein
MMAAFRPNVISRSFAALSPHLRAALLFGFLSVGFYHLSFV